MTELPSNYRQSLSLGQEIISGAILGVFLTRYFLVTESGGQGDTLWIVGLWLIVWLLWLIASRWSPSSKVPFGWLDASVGLLAGGHILSAIVVIVTTGEKRSAINLAWEWVGVAVGWYLLRQQCQKSTFRRELIVALIATGTVSAGQGLYQHYVEFPSMAAKYGPLFDRLKTANPDEAANIRQELAREHIPAEEPAITLFEKRLRDSREPLGLFALANTLGGFLAVCLVLTASLVPTMKSTVSMRHSDYQVARWRIVPWILILAILGSCLLLTKSRTAWIGTAAGLMIWMVGTTRVRLTGAQLRGVGIALLIVILTGWGLSRIGGLDRQVFTEAPKSLQYRLQYWSATWPMIRDHLWLGVGPGQFRSQYLFYKKAEASEEIADPHNLILDAAANGGLVAFFGLVVFCIAVARIFRRPAEAVSVIETTKASLVVPVVISGFVTIAWVLLLTTGYDDRLLVLMPIALALCWWLRGSPYFGIKDSNSIFLGSLAATIALLVHLLGAGGMGMPAISLLLLVLATVAELPVANSKKLVQANFWAFDVLKGSVCLGFAILLYFTGLRPVTAVEERLQTGDRFFQRGNPDAADAEYSAAAASDSFSPEPWRRRAELAYRKAEADRFRSNESFMNAVRLMEKVRLLDPLSPHDHRRLGDWWLARWSVTNQSQDAEEAVSAYKRAMAMYPTNALLMADLAFALEAAGTMNESGIVAGKALEQDRINQERGHVDRLLTDLTRSRLMKLSGRQKSQ